jgi:hypothetical protein
MRRTLATRIFALVAAALAAGALLSAGPAGAAGRPAGHPTGRLVEPGAGLAALDRALGISRILRTERPSETAPAAGLPPKPTQIKVLDAVLKKMKGMPAQDPGSADVFAYQIGQLWRQGIDGAGTTVAVIEGWNFPGIAAQVAAIDKLYGLPNPHLSTIYPAGPLPKTCPAGMQKTGSFGDCASWADEMIVDVAGIHILAPYAKIVIAVTPPDTEGTEDAASQIAPPEMMKAVEDIAGKHLANVISISDNIGESSYRNGAAEITAQTPGELAAAAAGIPLLVATGDCGVAQNLPEATAQCADLSTTPDTGTWDDSPWVTAVGGSTPVLNKHDQLAGPPQLWHEACCSAGAGYSAVFARPAYQDGVAAITDSPMRSVPDITMDAVNGTSLATPLLAGVLSLATQVNHGDLGPINPVLYGTLGPAGGRAGIVDVIGGSDSTTLPDHKVIPGFTAVKGFDVASGWGTVNAARFVPSLVAATRAAHQDTAVRAQARGDLVRLEHALTLSPDRIGHGGASYLLGTGFLPDHPVRLTIDGRLAATLRAGGLGTVTDMIDPATLHLAPGWHTVGLTSLLLTETDRFRSS